MIFRFVSDDDWHSLFKEKGEGTSDVSTAYALSSVSVRRCAERDPSSFIQSIKFVDKQFEKSGGSDSLARAANNGG
jgi:hypothetical protein